MNNFTHSGLTKSNIEKDLQESLNKGRLVAFIGAGISLSQGYPSWSKLIGSMINEHVPDQENRENLDKYFRQGNFEIIAEFIKQKLEPQYKRFLHETFASRGNTVGSLYEAIVQIPFHSFITTNYDKSLELSLKETKQATNIQIADYSFDWGNIQKIQETIKSSGRHVFHAHGMRHDDERSTAESIILAESEYKELRRTALYREYLTYIFKNFTVLFLGFGMKDWEIEWIDNLISEQIGHTNNLYVLTANMPSIFLELSNKPESNFKWISYECKEVDSLAHQKRIIDFLKILTPSPKNNSIQFSSSEPLIEIGEDDSACLLTMKTKVQYSKEAISRAKAKDDVFILDTYAEYLTHLEQELIDAIGRGVSIKILFLERGSFFSQDRSRSLGLSDTYIDNMLLGCDRIIKRIAKKQEKFIHNWNKNGCKDTEPGTIRYKLYNQSPTYSLVCVSHTNESQSYSTIFNTFSPNQMGMHSPCYEVRGDKHTMFYLNGFDKLWYGSSKEVLLKKEPKKKYSLETVVKQLGSLPFSENYLDSVIESFSPDKVEMDKIIKKHSSNVDPDKPYKKINAYEYFNITRKQDDLDIFILYWPNENKSNAPHFHYDTKGYMYLAKGKTCHTIFNSEKEARKYIKDEVDIGVSQEILMEGRIIKLRKGLIHSKESLTKDTVSVHFYYPPLRKQKFYDKDTDTWEVITGNL